MAQNVTSGGQDTCALREALPRDAAAVEAFLAGHPATSMFLRGNLARYGTQERQDMHGTTFYLHEVEGQIRAVFGRSNGGYLMAQAPDASPAVWSALTRALKGCRVVGMTGVPAQVIAGLDGLGLSGAAFKLNANEPLYLLEIAAMTGPDADVREARPADLAMLIDWFHAYEVDVGQAIAGDPVSEATKARAARAIGNVDVAVLEVSGAPVAMAGVNARLPDIVQIGGVFTPLDQRGRGYARAALAGLLRWNAARGVTQSVLFANNPAAARAYEALGYRHIGAYRVALLRDPQVIGDPI